MTGEPHHKFDSPWPERPADAVVRAKQDLQRGDYAMARQRLESYLVHSGYDPSLLAWIGRISHDMHDLRAAGRTWLVSTEEGDHVDQAVDAFMETVRGRPRQALMQLPRCARLASIDEYPPIVQARLRRLGLAGEVPAVFALRTDGPEGIRGVKEYVVQYAVLAFVLLFLGSSVLGACTAIGWLVGANE